MKGDELHMGNQLKTALLLAALTCIIIWIGQAVGGANGMVYAFIFALAMNLVSYWFSDKIVLKMYGAREITEAQAPELYGMVQKLSASSGLPMPRVFMIDSDSPNAFATGRNPQHAVVAVTTGIMKLLNREEIEGVLAHELAHVNNRDILIGTVAAIMAGMIMIVARMAQWAAIFGGASRDERDDGGGALGFIVLAVLAPLAATVIQLAISRSREYLADATGARFAGSPFGLANALKKISLASQRVPLQANPSTAHMFIVNPLSGRSLMSLFSTHPPVEERIKRLVGEHAAL
jgi:heat shock protein HtpX